MSIVVPAFNERATIETLIARLGEALHAYSYEIVIVDDGSTDDTLQQLAGYQQRNASAPIRIGALAFRCW